MKYQCIHCEKRFNDFTKLNQHGSVCVNRKYSCELCDQKFKTLHCRKDHMTRIHKVIKPLKHVHINDIPCNKEQSGTINEIGEDAFANSTNASQSENIDLEMDIKVEDTMIQEQEFQFANNDQ